MLAGCISLGELEFGKHILRVLEKARANRDTHYALLINAMGSTGNIDEAADLLQHMKDKKVRLEHSSAFTQAVWVYCAKNKLDDALHLFEEVRTRGLVLEEFVPPMLEVLAQYNTEEAMKVLNHDGPHAGADAYAVVAQVMFSKNELERGILLFREVERLRLPLTRDAVLIAVKLFGKAGHVHTALKWVEQLEKEGEKIDNKTNEAVVSTLMYHGWFQAAREKIKELRKKEKLSVEVYNVMVKQLVKRGHIDEALQIVTRQMKEDGITPNAQTFEGLLRCIEVGRLQVLLLYAVKISFYLILDKTVGTSSTSYGK
jgi:pentatricopeptide repeat protein